MKKQFGFLLSKSFNKLIANSSNGTKLYQSIRSLNIGGKTSTLLLR